MAWQPSSRLLFSPGETRARCAGIAAVAMLCGLFLSAERAWGEGANEPTFVPPPSSISDITAILSEKTPVEPNRLRKARELAGREPPATADRAVLAQFYYKRGRAARRISRLRQVIDDMSRANELRNALPKRLQSRILFFLGIAELIGGDRERGIGHTQQAMALAETRSFRIQLGAHLSQYLLASNPGESARLLSEAEDGARRLRTSPDPKLRQEWELNRDAILGRVTLYRGIYLHYLGRYAEAERQLHRAITHYDQLYEKLDRKWRREGRRGYPAARRTLGNHALMALGAALLDQGRLVEAEVAMRTALLNNLRQRGRNDRRTAKSIQFLARVMLAQGRPEDAETLQRTALKISHKVDAAATSKLTGDLRSMLAGTLLAQGKWAAALQQFRVLRASQGGKGILWEYRYSHHPVYALALLKTGHVAEALDTARRAVDWFVRTRAADRKRALARGVLAMALMAAQRERESLKEFGKAAPVLLESERQSGFGLLDPVEDARSRMVLEAYIGLLARIRGSSLEHEAGIDVADEAFRIADSLRGRSVQRALNASAARAAAGNDELADLVRVLQDTIGQIRAQNAHHAKLLSRPNLRPVAQTEMSFPKSISALTAKRDALRADLERWFPEYAALVSPEPPTIAKTRARLRDGEALVAIHVGETASYVWAVHKSDRVSFSRIGAGRKAIAALVARIRRGVTPTAGTLDGVPAFDVAAAHRLYRMLLAPVADAWRDADTLLITANGALSQLPFSLLVTRETAASDGNGALFSGYRSVPWLVRTHGVMALPSVSAFTTLRNLPRPKPGRRAFAAFADPMFANRPAAAPAAERPARNGPALVSRGVPLRFRATPPPRGRGGASLAGLPPLPDTAVEVRSIAKIMKADAARDLFIGIRANEHLVKTAPLDMYRILSFASHALLPGQLDGLTQPALALSAPEAANVAGDGLLTADEVLGLRLDADWVVLSACNTAMGSGLGSEAVSGLGRAFLYAGARALLVSHWQVESASARRLVTDLFRRQADTPAMSRSAALRQAMLALMDGPGYTDEAGRTVFSYAHPLFWAPFSVFGEGGSP